MTDELTDIPAWKALERHYRAVRDLHLRRLFAVDPGRAERFSFDAAGIHADLSKHRATAETLSLLVALALERRVPERRDAMFRGEHVNRTEDRPALHVALRMPRERSLVVGGRDVVRDVHDVLDRMAALSRRVRSGEWRGHTDRPVSAVVNIGIGGSSLGPAMAYEALRSYSDRQLTFRFVSNVDASDLLEALRGLDPAETLFVVSSKTFRTTETMTNAHTAREWLLDGLGGDEAAIARHMVAVSTNLEAVAAFGIDPANAFEFWDWVGGRYSMESAIGLSTMIAIGPEAFNELLAGFHALDRHFEEAPLERNVPVLMGLLGVWYRDFFGAQTHAVLPYEQYLSRFPAYLQQLVMESNGKRVTEDGRPVAADTAPIVWGEVGTNGQHSFHQLLHQGTTIVPVDVVAFATSLHAVGPHHDLLLANALAQAEALAFGRTEDELRRSGIPEALVPHKTMPGNRPSTFLLLARLTPFALGSLVALYEHVVFTQGAVWGIDPFDQWGVELGKELATRLVPAVAGEGKSELDGSTAALLGRITELRQED
jgi:glucose-6-phosphate isomerase